MVGETVPIQLRKALGVSQIVGECLVILTMLGAILLEFLATVDLTAYVTLFAVLSFGLVASARLGACAIVLRDSNVAASARIDECFRFMFFPGWRASRYLRTGRLEL